MSREEDYRVEEELLQSEKPLSPIRITPLQVDSMMASLQVQAYRFPGTTTTVAIAILPGNFVVAVGKSAALSMDNFNVDIGERLAKSDALDKARRRIWELEGYALHKRSTCEY